MKKIFTGFSTAGGDPKEFTLHDIPLIRQDLLNHFHTIKGERVMRPDFGCEIWDYIMEPFTPSIKKKIVDEALRICSSDPRVLVDNIDVYELSGGNAYNVTITLTYRPFNVLETFSVKFENRQRIY